MFNINWNNIIITLLPPFLRQARTLTWLVSMLKPLATLHQLFLAYKGNYEKQLYFNGQVINLEKLLNDTFNSGLPGIYIIDGASLAQVYIYNKAEALPPVYLYNASEADAALYIYNSAESLATYDFIVKVPSYIYAIIDIAQMQALINFYKIAPKTYIIQAY